MKNMINIDLLAKTLRADGWTMNATDYIVNAVETHAAHWQLLKKLTTLQRRWGADGCGQFKSAVEEMLCEFSVEIANIKGGTQHGSKN